MRGTTRVRIALVVAAAAALVLAATAAAQVTAPKPIVIGWAFDSKGAMAPFDNPALAAAQVRVKQLNARGGVMGRPFQIITCDTQGNKPAIAKACATKLLGQGADVIFTTCDVDLASPVVQESIDAGKLTIAPCIGTDQIDLTAASAAGVPAAVRDRGRNNTPLSMNRLSGVPFRGLVDFSVDHGQKEDWSATLSYWNGTAWVETPVWDPGGHLTRPDLLTPSPGEYVAGTVQVRASIAYTSLVTEVEFYLDSETSPRGSVAAPDGNVYTWNWDTAGVPDGWHTVRARGVDVWNGGFEGTVAVRVRGAGKKQDIVPVEQFIARVTQEIAARALVP